MEAQNKNPQTAADSSHSVEAEFPLDLNKYQSSLLHFIGETGRYLTGITETVSLFLVPLKGKKQPGKYRGFARLTWVWVDGGNNVNRRKYIFSVSATEFLQLRNILEDSIESYDEAMRVPEMLVPDDYFQGEYYLDHVISRFSCKQADKMES